MRIENHLLDTEYYCKGDAMRESDLYWQTYIKLENELVDLSHHIYISDKMVQIKNDLDEFSFNQLYVYSPYIADLIVRCGVEIEAISKELYFKNGGEPKKKEHYLKFDSDCIKLLHNKWNFTNKQVNIVSLNFDLSDENSILFPLKDAHIKYKTLWKKTYQELKHNRYKNISKGNIKALLESMAALYLLNVYNKNNRLYCKYNEIKNLDYSSGSKLFSVVAPSFQTDNEFKTSSSPYIASFSKVGFNKILELEESKKDYLYIFLLKQPETRNQSLFNYIQEDYGYFNLSDLSIEEAFKYLGKFRIKEKYKGFNSFQEKKNAFLNSNEINGELYQNAKEFKQDELNENNIDSAIELAGSFYGLEIMNKHIREVWVPISKNEQICEVLIPE